MTRSQIQTLIDSLADNQPNTAATVRSIFSAIADGTGQTGDVRELDVSTAYIAANFDGTGLGINERVGWAICNGNNGTRNRLGRVGVQYDPSNFPTLGTTGGSKDAVVVAHSHTVNSIKSYNNTFGTNGFYDRSQGASSNGIVTESTGESGVGKNMQPYIVSLFIMKL